MTDDVDAYCQLRHSRLPKKSRVKSAPAEYAVSAGISTASQTSTSLRLLELDDRYDKQEYFRSESRDFSPNTFRCPWREIAPSVQNLFKRGWKHPDKAFPDIQRIFAVVLPNHLERPYLAYESRLERSHGDSGVNEKLVFHGTPRYCRLGDGDKIMGLCKKSACGLCAILRQSFSVKQAGTAPDRDFLRFGHGIYTSSASSKADDYTDDHSNSQNRVLLVARAALGKGKVLRRNTENLRSPPSGYASVLGEVGFGLNYDEQVLYRDNAIRSAYVIIYEP
ncbi:hypothetical protein M407DRAFT_211142 [Tulasnella calospora MUT 4182]|uniref:PARP catalytic domain-containing protein n=1 Tax=Tulasnella calospora MUT 4182 TaxID=1051891 RepID=A0A0C3LUG8_9AGAM|nr:hypothetical protein M407DRAFT_211142 [Tulasnella calospora MUT 4182]